MLSFLSEDVRRNPFSVYEQMRRACPVYLEANSGLYLLFDYPNVKRALNDQEAFSSDLITTAKRPTPAWIIFMDPPRHSKLRAIVMKAFTPRMITNLEPRIRDLSRGLLNNLIARGHMDLAVEYAVPLPMLVIAEMIGIPSEDWTKFRRWSDVILGLSYTVAENKESTAARQQYYEVSMEIKDYLPKLVEDRLKKPREDVLTSLATAEVDGQRLSPEELIGFFQLLIVAGQETTANLINNAIVCLLDHPDQMQRLQQNPGLFGTMVEEVLRFRSPIQWVFRATKVDVEMCGQKIPAGKLVLPVLGSANRDEKEFSRPDVFDIGRDPNPHVAFGHGLHFCLGAALARTEARIALPHLLNHLKGLRMASASPWQPRKALHVHGPSSLPIEFEPAGPINA
jgi:cytochrome P450